MRGNAGTCEFTVSDPINAALPAPGPASACARPGLRPSRRDEVQFEPGGPSPPKAKRQVPARTDRRPWGIRLSGSPVDALVHPHRAVDQLAQRTIVYIVETLDVQAALA